MNTELSSPKSGRVQGLRRLTQRSGRTEAGRFLAEGPQVVREALRAHGQGTAHVHEVLHAAAPTQRRSDLLSLARSVDVPTTSASEAVLTALSETVTPQGVVAVVDHLDVELQAGLRPEAKLVAVLADVRDPGNAGSAVRAADAAGADAVVFAGSTVDPYNGKAVRASAGGLFHLPIVTGVSVATAMDAARRAGMAVLVADGYAVLKIGAPEVSAALQAPTAWVFGNEAWGVDAETVRRGDLAVGVPIYGNAESLNLATAVALCLYESARSHRLKAP